MGLIRAVIAIAAFICPTLTAAQVSTAIPSTTDERRLTPEEVEAVLTEAAAKRTAAAKQIPAAIALVDEADTPPAPEVHGEVGFAIGSGGYRETFGTAIYPLGNDGIAAISLDFVDWGHRRFPR